MESTPNIQNSNMHLMPVFVDKDLIRAEQIKLLFQQLPVSLIAVAITAIILTTFLWAHVPHNKLIIWLIFVLLVVFTRTGMCYMYLQLAPQPEESNRWLTWFFILTLLSGTLWGLAGSVLIPNDLIIYRVFTLLFIGALVAGAIANHAVLIPVYLAFSLPIVILLSGSRFVTGDQMEIVTGVMIIMFFGIMLLYAFRINKTIYHSLILQLENLQLISFLNNEKIKIDKLNTERFRAAFADASIGMALVSLDHSILETNQAFCTMLGYSKEEITGIFFKDITHPDDMDISTDHHHRLITGEINKYHFEKRYLHKQGHEVFALLSVSLVRDEDTTPLYAIAQMLDITERKQVEEALRISEEKFSKAFRSCPFAVSVTSIPDGLFIDVNDAAEKLTGYNRNELIGRTSRDIDLWVNLQDQAKLHEKLKKEGSVSNFETDMRIKSGEIRNCEVSAEVIKIKGKPCIIAITRDVTASKRAESELRESEERYRLLVETMNEGLGIVDENGLLTYVNDQLCEMLGFPREEMIGLSITDFTDGINLKIIENQLEQRKEGRNEPYEIAWTAKDGRKVDTIVSPTLLIDKDDIFRGSFATVTDITERKKVEEALLVSEERYRSISMSSTVTMIVSVDQSGSIISWNTAAEKIFGYSEAEILGHPLIEIIPERYRPANLEGFQRAAKTEEYRIIGKTIELHGLKKSGKEFPIELSLSTWKQGGTKYFSAIIHDITERQQAEEALRDSENKFATAFRNSPDGVVLSTLSDGRIIDISENVEQMTGYRRDDIIGQSTLELGIWRDPEARADMIKVLQNEGKIKNVCVDMYTRAGELRQCELSAEVIDIGDEPCMITNIRDVTERKRAEETLMAMVEGTASVTGSDFFRSMVRHLAAALRVQYVFVTECIATGGSRVRSLAFWCDDHFGDTIEYNVKGTPCKQVTMEGCPIYYASGIQGLFPEDRDLADLGVDSYLGVPIIDSSETVIGHLVLLHSTPIDDAFRAQSVLQIFAARAGAELERQQADNQIRQSREQLRNLAASLQAAREEERTIIARDIHDELGQTLTGLKMDLSWVRDRMPRNWKKLPERMQAMISLVDSTVDYVGKLSARLRPAILDDLGLEAAIEWELQVFAKRTNCNYTLDFKNGKMSQDRDRNTAVFRIFQEALTNVTRHAKATEVGITLRTSNSQLILEVKDDGVGIAEDKINSTDSIGLFGMQERAGAFGGHVYIDKVKEGGTQVRLVMPLATH